MVRGYEWGDQGTALDCSFFVEGWIARMALALTGIACIVTASYLVWRKEREATIAVRSKLLDSEQRRAVLEVRFDGNVEPYIIRSGQHCCCRFAIYNQGPNVRVWLKTVTPRLKLPDGHYPPHFPSPVSQ
jgi:hypothetical protein